MSEYSWEAAVSPLVAQWGARVWKRDPDREQKICDAQSVAWEFFQTAGPTATPQTIAAFAIRHVASGRQFRESSRSITGPNPRRRPKPRRAGFDPSAIFREGANPARVVCFRDLYQVWLETLNDRQRKVVELLANGDRTEEAAAKCGLTPGRISQIRREVERRWHELGT